MNLILVTHLAMACISVTVLTKNERFYNLVEEKELRDKEKSYWVERSETLIYR